MSVWGKVTSFFRPKQTATTTTTTAPVKSATPSPTGATIRTITPSTTTTGSVTTSGGVTRVSGGGSSSPSISTPTTSATLNQAITGEKPSIQTAVQVQQARTTAQQVQQSKATTPVDNFKDMRTPVERTFLQRIGLTRGDTPPIQEVGAFIVTPEEAMGMKGSRQPYVTTEGLTTERFTSGLSITPFQVVPKSPFGTTREGYIKNTELLEAQKNIFIAEADVVRDFKLDPESFRGTAGFTESDKGYSISQETFSSKIDYDSILGGAKDTARARYSELDKGTRARLIGSEVGIGVAKVGVAVPLAGVNLAIAGTTATFTEDDLKKDFSWGTALLGDGSRSIKFSPTTTFGRIQDAQVGWLGKGTQIATTGALIATGVGLNVKSTGSFKEGLLETASYGGMYKIKSGVYTPSVTGKNTIVESVKLTKTGRIYTGKVGDTGITFKGIEVGGRGVIQTTTPTFNIRAGGLRTDFGTITTGQSYVNIPATPFTFGSIKGSVGQQMITGTQTTTAVGGKFRSFEQDFTRVSYTPSQATFLKPVSSNVNYFVTSPAKPIYQYTAGKNSFSYAPSGRFNVPVKLVETGTTFSGRGGIQFKEVVGVLNPKIVGREINLANLFSSGRGSTGSSFTGGGMKTPFSVTFQQQTTAGLAPPVIRIPSTTTTTAPPMLGFSQTMDTRTTTQQTGRIFQVPKVTSLSSQDTKTTGLLLTPPIVIQTPTTRGGSGRRVVQVPRIDVAPRQDERTDTIITPIFRTPSSPLTPTTPRPFTPFTPMPFKFPRLPLGDGGLSSLGRVGARRTYKYTPSFGALVKGTAFKVGKTSTRKFTGLEFRGGKQSDSKLLKGFKIPTTKRKKKGKKK